MQQSMLSKKLASVCYKLVCLLAIAVSFSTRFMIELEHLDRQCLTLELLAIGRVFSGLYAPGIFLWSDLASSAETPGPSSGLAGLSAHLPGF